jgi:AGZA family xanthine/uracil permease-like MFS transporter
MGDSLFHLKQKQTSIRVEIVAGLTTFLTMAYIIFLNPAILSAAGMDKQALIIVTCIVTAVITIITGLFTNAPIAMAPGMGLNAVVIKAVCGKIREVKPVMWLIAAISLVFLLQEKLTEIIGV